MTDEELKQKAFKYRKEVVPYTELGYPDVLLPVYLAMDIELAYVSGANVYKPKWHKVADGDLPKEKKEYWCKVFYYESEETFNAFLWFDPDTEEFKFQDTIGEDDESGFNVKEWCEIPEE